MTTHDNVHNVSRSSPTIELPPFDANGIVWYSLVSLVLLAQVALALAVASSGDRTPRLTKLFSTAAALGFYIAPLRQDPTFIFLFYGALVAAAVVAFHPRCAAVGKFFVGAALPIGILDVLVCSPTGKLSLFLPCFSAATPDTTNDLWQILTTVAMVVSLLCGAVAFELSDAYLTIATVCSGSFLASLGLSTLVALFCNRLTWLDWFPWVRLGLGAFLFAGMLWWRLQRLSQAPCTDQVVDTTRSNQDILPEKYPVMYV